MSGAGFANFSQNKRLATEDALQPIQFLLQTCSTDFQGHPKAMIFMSVESQYATSY